MRKVYFLFLITLLLASCISSIHESVRDGDKSAVLSYIESSKDLNVRAGKYLPGEVTISNEMTPLMVAISSGNYEITKLLIDAKADYKIATILKGNLLHLGVNFDRPRIVKLLIDKGLDVNKNDNLNNSPLNIHCLKGNYQSVKLLLEAGADVNNLNSSGKPPIILAAVADKNGVKIMELLLKYGAKIDQEDKDGYQAIHHAKPAQVDFLLKKGVSIETKDKYGNTPFQRWAAQRYYKNNLVMLKHFADKGCNVNVKTESGSNAIHIAVSSGNDKETIILLNKLGVKNGADDEGNTSLHIAYMKKRGKDIINTLIKIGVNPFQRNNKGLLPKDMRR